MHGYMDAWMVTWMDFQRLALLITLYIEYGDHHLMGCKEMMQEIGLSELKQKQVQLCMCGWQGQEDLQQWKIEMCKPPQSSLNLVHFK